MKLVSWCVVFALVAAPALAAEEQSSSSSNGHHAMFWSGLALAVAGVATSVAGVTVARTGDSSTGNAPPGTYAACVAQKSNPIYATNDCDPLKAKNRAMLWSGVAIAGAGAVLMIGSTHTSAEIAPGAVRVLHTIKF